jgi:ParB/RepB/Spo0J family partition protein
MNKQTKVSSNEMTLHGFDCQRLFVAPENPRANDEVKEDEIKLLADSIYSNGILTPLIGYFDGDNHVQITAGGRRLRAIQFLVDEYEGYDPEIPVYITNQYTAAHFGVAEQLAHQQLSRRDEVKLFSMDQYVGMSDTALAGLIGKSKRYVQQHRRVLQLPEPVIETFFAGGINYDHALGLTYWIDEPEAEMTEMFEHVVESPNRYDLEDLRNIYLRSKRTWEQNPLSKHVTEDAYLKAGGKLSGDLFTEESFIDHPDILRELAEKKIAAKVKKAVAPEKVVMIPESEVYVRQDRHDGINTLTEEEQVWLDDNRYHFDSQWTEEERLAHKEKVREYEAREETYPDELASLLEARWCIAPNHAEGYVVKKHCIPEDREALYVAGFLDRPVEQEAEAEGQAEAPQPEVGLSQALKSRIEDIKLHAERQELASDEVAVAELYTAHLRKPFSTVFSMTPPNEPEVTLHYGKPWLRMQKLAEKADPTKAEIRTILMHEILMRLATRQSKVMEAEVIRRYFTPDAAFLKAYKLGDLLRMAEELEIEVSATPKKGQVVEQLAEYASEQDDWLPVGF